MLKAISASVPGKGESHVSAAAEVIECRGSTCAKKPLFPDRNFP